MTIYELSKGNLGALNFLMQLDTVEPEVKQDILTKIQRCAIRPDIISAGLSVYIGEQSTNTEDKLYYRWGGDLFYIWYNCKWNLAQSIDFEF